MNNIICDLGIRRVRFNTPNTTVFIDRANDLVNSSVVSYDTITGERTSEDEIEVDIEIARKFAFWMHQAAFCTSKEVMRLDEADYALENAREYYPVTDWTVSNL